MPERSTLIENALNACPQLGVEIIAKPLLAGS